MWERLTARFGGRAAPPINLSVARIEAERAAVRDVLTALGASGEELDRRAKRQPEPKTMEERVNVHLRQFFPGAEAPGATEPETPEPESPAAEPAPPRVRPARPRLRRGRPRPQPPAPAAEQAFVAEAVLPPAPELEAEPPTADEAPRVEVQPEAQAPEVEPPAVQAHELAPPAVQAHELEPPASRFSRLIHPGLRRVQTEAESDADTGLTAEIRLRVEDYRVDGDWVGDLQASESRIAGD
jgi:hypothetical protein